MLGQCRDAVRQRAHTFDLLGQRALDLEQLRIGSHAVFLLQAKDHVQALAQLSGFLWIHRDAVHRACGFVGDVLQLDVYAVEALQQGTDSGIQPCRFGEHLFHPSEDRTQAVLVGHRLFHGVQGLDEFLGVLGSGQLLLHRHLLIGQQTRLFQLVQLEACEVDLTLCTGLLGL